MRSVHTLILLQSVYQLKQGFDYSRSRDEPSNIVYCAGTLEKSLITYKTLWSTYSYIYIVALLLAPHTVDSPMAA